jgi:predicted xylose isomerase-like sugar epimerase
MHSFTQAELVELVEIGDRMRAAAKRPAKEASEAFKQITDEQRKLVMDWMHYRITGKDERHKNSSGNTKGNGLVIFNSGKR